MRFFALPAILSLCVSGVFAAPLKEDKRASVSAASSATISAFKPYVQFAHAAYCSAGAATWTCGAACSAIPDFVNYAGGGNSAATPYWYVGWSPSLSSIIVAHEGTDPTQFLSLLNDADFIQTQLDQASWMFALSLFPGISKDIYVHNGFQDTFERSAPAILAAVKKVMSLKSSSKVTVIGHSLGGALALLDTAFLKLQIPSLTTKTVVFGVPRVGNTAFANYMSKFDLTRINHEQDPIPTVPGRGLGYNHPTGEIHESLLDGVWYNCPGIDNTDYRCSTGAVPTIFNGNIFDHLGPYNDIYLGTIYC